MASSRSANVYADFLLPHLTSGMRLVDVGCGSGALSLQLAAHVRRLVGVDDDPTELELARAAALAAGLTSVDFLCGDACSLALGDASVDAVLGHSVLEALDQPSAALAEMNRVLVPGGLVAVASVEYGGLVLAGPHPELTRRFYEVREQLWVADGAAPWRGRELRGLLLAGGFIDVDATTKYICYGTDAAVRDFGLGRADDCLDEWYVEGAQRKGLASLDDLRQFREAWLEWSESSTSYAAFAWCRALGRKA